MCACRSFVVRHHCQAQLSFIHQEKPRVSHTGAEAAVTAAPDAVFSTVYADAPFFAQYMRTFESPARVLC